MPEGGENPTLRRDGVMALLAGGFAPLLALGNHVAANLIRIIGAILLNRQAFGRGRKRLFGCVPVVHVFLSRNWGHYLTCSENGRRLHLFEFGLAGHFYLRLVFLSRDPSERTQLYAR